MRLENFKSLPFNLFISTILCCISFSQEKAFGGPETADILLHPLQIKAIRSEFDSHVAAFSLPQFSRNPKPLDGIKFVGPRYSTRIYYLDALGRDQVFVLPRQSMTRSNKVALAMNEILTESLMSLRPLKLDIKERSLKWGDDQKLPFADLDRTHSTETTNQDFRPFVLVGSLWSPYADIRERWLYDLSQKKLTPDESEAARKTAEEVHDYFLYALDRMTPEKNFLIVKALGNFVKLNLVASRSQHPVIKKVETLMQSIDSAKHGVEAYETAQHLLKDFSLLDL